MCLVMVFFLNIYISFSIPFSTHDLIRFDLICFDPFSKDSNSLSSQVPNTLDSPSHVLHHFPLHYTRRVRASNSASIDTLFSRTPDAPSSHMVSQAPSKIVDAYIYPHTFVSPISHQIFLIHVILNLLWNEQIIIRDTDMT